MNKIRNVVVTAAVIVTAVFLPTNAVLAKNSNASFTQLSAEWWQWVLSIPPSINPLLDTNGDNCMVGQHGTTWFLAGSWVSGPVTRDCDIPQGTTLFFPVINEINFDTPGQCGQGAPLPSSSYRALSAAFISGASNLSVTVDGKSAGPMHHTVSPVFEVALPDDNIFAGACAPAPDLTGGIYSPAVDEGYYVSIKPLAVGDHTLNIHAEAGGGSFTLDITYNLTVVPVVSK
jgi:hypothetical protein